MNLYDVDYDSDFDTDDGDMLLSILKDYHLTKYEVACALKCSVSTLNKWIAAGKIPAGKWPLVNALFDELTAPEMEPPYPMY